MWTCVTQIHTIICVHAGRGIEFRHEIHSLPVFNCISLNVFPGLGLQDVAGISNSSIQASTLRKASILYCCSATQSCPTLSVDCSAPGLPVLHQLQELAQTHVHWVSDAIQPSHPLSSPSPPAFNLSQHQGLFWVGSSHQVVSTGGPHNFSSKIVFSWN